MADQKTDAATRRQFLTLTGAAALGGVAAASVPTPSAAKQDDRSVPSSGYRETDHVRTYYELAGF